MKYSALTRQWFESAANAGKIDGDMARGSAGARDVGTWVQFDVRQRGGVIEVAHFQVLGCPHTIAVAAWLAAQAPGAPLVAQLPESVHALQQRFEVPVAKLGRLLLVEDAWVAAIRAALPISGAEML